MNLGRADSNFILERSSVYHFSFHQQHSMSDFVWDWPSACDGWQVGQSFDTQGIRAGEYITDKLNRITEREFTGGCAFIITIHSPFSTYTIDKLRGTSKGHVGGGANETNMAKMPQSLLAATSVSNKKSSMSVQLSTSPQQARSSLPSAVTLFHCIFC